MVRIVFGNHSSILIRRQDRKSIRDFYCGVLGKRRPTWLPVDSDEGLSAAAAIDAVSV